MSYTTLDFAESLDRVGIKPDAIHCVAAAWGRGDGQGKDSGLGWSVEGVTDWSGGFLFQLKDGRYAYVSGWCDYTGWGCQDGATVVYFDALPDQSVLESKSKGWDKTPIDLNKWLIDGGKHPYND